MKLVAAVRFFITCPIGIALASCQMFLNVGVRFEGSEPVFTFSEGGSSSAGSCIWNFEIVDDQSNESVVTRTSGKDCVRLRSLRLSQPPAGLTGKGGLSDMTAGRTYHVVLIWEKGIGSYRSWVAG